MTEQDSGKEVFLTLFQANVLRLRRQYDLAEAQCSEVLRREPDNAEAHSILGDIARDRGNDQDAIQWYKMALDLNPGNIADRKKLESAIDRVYSRSKENVLNRFRNNVSDTFSSTAEEIRAARLPSAATITLGVVVAVIMVVAILVVVLGRTGNVVPEPAAADSTPGGFVSPETTVLEPRPLDREPALGETGGEPRFTGEVAPLESALLATLRQEARVLDPNCVVEDARIDAQDGIVSVLISMPRLMLSEHTRSSIVRVAAPLAVIAVGSDPRVAVVRMRCDTREREQQPVLAFTAEARPEDIAYLADDRNTWSAEQVFATMWWDARLRPHTELVPSPGAQ
ncbi:MAG: tetratricopeptide repeat protein [Armatimonadetes bacterium]|nr:tetratricopeptide repeat protein [Armatimonadota bacterium]